LRDNNISFIKTFIREHPVVVFYISKTGRTGIIYYFTGINMKNMNAIPEISNSLLRLL